ncbi:MAG: ATP-binding protein [Candidatus Accumulibacter sp.]|jgi:predicted ATPase|nr:ATP-binding protein [Accumulibacter sp.]
MLTDVTIEGLRGVGRVELHFAPEQRVYTLFGENGVGKTKCLEALWQFLLISNKEFAQASWRQPGQSVVVSENKTVMARMTANELTFEAPKTANGSFRLSDVWKTQNITFHSYPVVFLGAARRASLANINAVRTHPLGKFSDRRKEFFAVLCNALQPHGDLNGLGMSDDTRAWFVTRAQSTNPYQKSKDNRQAELEAVLTMLNFIEPRIDPAFLQIDGSGGVFLKVADKDGGVGEERELGELSSGFAALLKMIQAIIAGYAAFTNEVQLRNVRGIVLIDEIDAHLHAEWQANIIPCLKNLLPNTTFYIATHSPLVLVQLKEKEAYLLKRDDDGVVRSSIIRHPNRRLFIDVLEDGMGVNLNRLKRENDDPSEARAKQEAKERLLSLLIREHESEGV